VDRSRLAASQDDQAGGGAEEGADGLIVLTLEGERVSAVTGFVDNDVLGWFGLPLSVAF
jgi:hypothetical protein